MGCWFSKSAADAKPPPYDFQRKGPLRYLGYAGHIGTACGSVLPCSAAYVPQMVATAYILGDVWHRTSASSEKGDKPHRVAITAFDALIWQLLASVFIPGLVFEGVKTAAKPLFASKSKGCAKPASFATRLVPCALALLVTPLIITPIDKGVDFLMNSTYRSWTAPTDEELKDPRTLEKEARAKADQAAKAKRDAEAKAKKEAKELADKAKKEAQELADKAKRAEKERLEQERKARELERKKCEEEAKAIKAKIAAEEKALKDKLKREEQEFKEKQAQIEKEFKQQGASKMECK